MPRTLASKVESGERLAVPTMVCAARWKTALTSCSLRIREERLVVGEVGQHDGAARLDALGAEARLGIDVAPRNDDAGPRVEQPLGQPGADEALGPGDEDGAAAPGGRDHTRRRCASLAPGASSSAAPRAPRAGVQGAALELARARLPADGAAAVTGSGETELARPCGCRRTSECPSNGWPERSCRRSMPRLLERLVAPASTSNRCSYSGET